MICVGVQYQHMVNTGHAFNNNCRCNRATYVYVLCLCPVLMSPLPYRRKWGLCKWEQCFYPSHGVNTRSLCQRLWGAKSCVSLDSICFNWFEMELSVEQVVGYGYIHPMVMVMAMMSMYVDIQSNQPSCVYIIIQMKNNY